MRRRFCQFVEGDPFVSYVTRSNHDKEVEIPSYSALLEMLNQGFPNKLLIVSVYTVGVITALAKI